MTKIKILSLSAAFVVAIFGAATAAERFSEDHFCDPKLSNVEIMSCMSDLFESLDNQRLELEQARLLSEEELKKEGAAEAQELIKKSTELFQSYRDAECTSRVDESFSLSAHGEVGCKIRLTEQRIEILEVK